MILEDKQKLDVDKNTLLFKSYVIGYVQASNEMKKEILNVSS